jgi:hypothetical protein
MADPFIPIDIELDAETNDRNIAGLKEEEVDDKFIAASKTEFDRFASERTEYETVWKVLDNMWKCAQNQTIVAEETGKGANKPSTNTERANTGATILYRMVNQGAAMFTAVRLSKDSPFQYTPIVNKRVQGSDQEMSKAAEKHNIMARWTMKKDDQDTKAMDFAIDLYKYANVAEMIFWKEEMRKKIISVPEFEEELQLDGTFIMREVGRTLREEVVPIASFASVEQIPLRNVYADINIGDIQKQNCVIILDIVSISEIIEEVRKGEYSKDQFVKLTNDHMWDGSLGSDAEERQKAEGHESTNPPSNTNKYLRFSIFHFVPIAEGVWDEGKNVPAIHHGIVIGNTIDGGVLMKLERNRDPMDMIPIHITKGKPGFRNSMYAMAFGQAIRSNYSVECTLKNQVIDEVALNLDAPILIQEGNIQNETSFEYDRGPWFCQDTNTAMGRAPAPNGVTAVALQLLDWIKNDSQTATGYDKPFTGESFGARTSALESGNIFRSAQQPHLADIRYGMKRERWYANGIKSYTEAFGSAEQIMSITDDNGNITTVAPGELKGEFDIEINIVDEFEDSALRSQSLNEMLGIIGQFPQFLERTNIEEFLFLMYEEKKLPASRLVHPTHDFDSLEAAERAVQTMLGGTYVQPQPNQNHSLHISVVQAEFLRWRHLNVNQAGLTNEEKQMIANAQLFLPQHLEQRKLMIQSQNAPAPAGQQNQTEGEAQSNPVAGLQGGIQG